MGLLIWAQTGPDEAALALLALRRWFGSLTLSSPEATPRPFGLWALLFGLSALFLVALLAQGPGRSLGQFLNLAAHARLFNAALDRLRRSGRLVVVLLGASVLGWTGYLFVRYASPIGLQDLAGLVRTKSIREVALEQGILTALTPARDVLVLGDFLILLIPATILAFRLQAERWSQGMGVHTGRGVVPAGASIAWGAMGLYALYRVTGLIVPTADLPLNGCLVVEAPIIPLLALVADAVLAGWAFTELSRPSRGGQSQLFDAAEALRRAPAAALACLAAMPARYLGLFAYLASFYLPNNLARPIYGAELGWKLVGLQGLGLLGLILVAAAARGGSWRRVLGRSVRLLRESGGHLAAWVALCSLAAGTTAALAYLLVLSLPAQPWVVGSADEYAHFATLPFGLILLAGLVELADLLPPDPADLTLEASEVEIDWLEREDAPTDHHQPTRTTAP